MSIEVDVGTPPEGCKDWITTVIRFHGFANLPTTRDEYVSSPEFSCFGHQWRLDLYPGGEEDSEVGYVDVELANLSNTSIKIQYGYSVRNADGKEVVHEEPEIDEFDTEDGNGECSWCTEDFAKRSKLMKSLVDGALVIEVRMKSTTTTDKSITQFVPPNPFNKNVDKLFMDEETADVLFEVGGEQAKGTTTRKKKRAKSTTTFHAHRILLKNNASTLYEMIGESDEGGGSTTISITDVKPDIFKHMIYYAYGGKLTDEELKTNAKDIIDACDKYGVVNLKLEAEAIYVKSTTFTIDNMMDNLLYADSKNLALLKEAVMDYVVANKRDIIGKVSFDNVPGSTCTDILTAMARGEAGEGDSNDYNNMRVGTLRKMLDEKGLDVDGSRESMISLLKEQSA